MDSKRIPRKVLYNTFGGGRLVGKPKKKKKSVAVEEESRDTGRKKLHKRSNGEIWVEKLHTRDQGPKKEEEE